MATTGPRITWRRALAVACFTSSSARSPKVLEWRAEMLRQAAAARK